MLPEEGPVVSAVSLLVVVDPAARRVDPESVRIAKDVLSAGATVKFCFPEDTEEIERAFAHRGAKRPVLVGDDLALLRTVRLLHRERLLDEAALSVVPVGPPDGLVLTHRLGVPQDTVTAARAVLDGVERRQGLLTDDSGGVVLGGLRVPAGAHDPGHGPHRRPGLWQRALLHAPWPHGPAPHPPEEDGPRLRVEADGVVLADLDRPVSQVHVSPADGARGLADVLIAVGSAPVRASARCVRISGADFHYRADAEIGGPVRTRTWTAHPQAWRLTLPR
ncbi:diacylglycerol kinase [Streptomyces polyrhachis]|uniref:Diacylglycerol kinase n=1 Tax=Streptomyces polyrhachis TaxID=1282885 RepID=A0ABW2GE52_9ACTN